MSRRRTFSAALFAAILATTLTSAPTAVAQETLTLAKAVTLAAERAPELAAARARAANAEAHTSAARAGHLPTLTAAGTLQGTAVRDAQPLDRDFVARSVTYTGAGIGAASMRWTLLDLGKTSNAVAAADATARAAAASTGEATAQLLGDAASRYVTLYYRDELRRATEATVAQRERLLVLAKALVKTGLQPPVEELRAGSRVEAARRDLATAEASAQDARAQLAGLLGLPTTFAVAEPQLPDLDLDARRAAREGEEARDMVKVAREEAAAAESAVGAALARYLPSLTLNADGSYRLAQNDTFPLRGSTLSGVASLVVSLPLFDATIPAGTRAASASAAEAHAQLALTIRDARTEAARATLVLRSTRDGVEHAKMAAEAAAAVFAVVQARYAQGLASPIELIDAEASDADARSSRANAQLTYALAIVRVLVATGRSARLKQGGLS